MKEQLKCSNCGAEINNVLKETNTKAGVNPSGDPNLLIKAHIAEYQALANRINGFMALQLFHGRLSLCFSLWSPPYTNTNFSTQPL